MIYNPATETQDSWATCPFCAHIIDTSDPSPDDQYRCLTCDHLHHASLLEFHYQHD